MWWWDKAKKQAAIARELSRHQKLQESQMALVNAATSTANAAEDVTTILKARLDDSLRQIEITSQLLSDALIICRSDGTVDSVNNAAERIFGWKKTEVQGRDISTLFRDEKGSTLTGPQIMDKFFNCHEGSLEDEATMDCIRGKRRNGELFWVEVNLSHVERVDGSSIIILVCRDATNRIETQKQLELNELRFRSIFEASLDGIFVVQNHHIVAANPAIAELLGYDVEAMVAQPLTNFVCNDHKVVVNKIHALRMKNDLSAKTYVINLIKPDHSTVSVLVSSTGMQWGDGKIASLMMIKNISDFQ